MCACALKQAAPVSSRGGLFAVPSAASALSSQEMLVSGQFLCVVVVVVGGGGVGRGLAEPMGEHVVCGIAAIQRKKRRISSSSGRCILKR
jgi:hypothetical protein